MSDKPKEIWAYPDEEHGWSSAGRWNVEFAWRDDEELYVHADVVETMVAAALTEAAEALLGRSKTLRKNASLAADTREEKERIVASETFADAYHAILATISPASRYALYRALLDERDRCAKIAEGEDAGPYFRLPALHGSDAGVSSDGEIAQASRAIAAAIRAQGDM